jgi:hypothetical protein
MTFCEMKFFRILGKNGKMIEKRGDGDKYALNAPKRPIIKCKHDNTRDHHQE